MTNYRPTKNQVYNEIIKGQVVYDLSSLRNDSVLSFVSSTVSQSDTGVKYEQAVYEDAPVIGEINTSTFKNEKFEFDKCFDKKKDFKASPLSLCY